MQTPREKRNDEDPPLELEWHGSDDADDEFGDIEHDEEAFCRWLESSKRDVNRDGKMPGFQPAGIKGSDSDLVVIRKWQAYMRSPKFAEYKQKGLLQPKRVEMAMYRQDLGDEGLAAQGLTPDLIVEFNHGHLTQRARLALIRGPEPYTEHERATWAKLSLGKVGRMEAKTVHTGKKTWFRRRTLAHIYRFDIENEPSKCMRAAVANGQLYVDATGFVGRKWWMGVDSFALEVPKLTMVAVDVIQTSRQLEYEINQMKRLIRAYHEAKNDK
jgi:hypothetical protein